MAWRLATPAAAAVGEWSVNPQSRVRLVSPWALAPREGEFRFGVQFKLAPGWHAYWKNSGDAGFAPSLVVKTASVRDAALLFPAPRRFDLRGGLVAFGYEDEVVYPVAARLEHVTGANLEILASIDYVVCADECVPYRYDVHLAQALAATGAAPSLDPEPAALLKGFEERLPLSEQAAELHASARLAPAEDGKVTLEIDLPVPSKPDATIFFLPHDRFQIGPPTRVGETARTRFRVPLEEKRVPAPPLVPSDFAWTATGLVLAGGGSGQRAAAGAVEGITSAVPLPGSVFPGIVLWPLLGAALLAVAVVLALRIRPRGVQPLNNP
jgi:DsbC/DsbD-like thiol-disulfide interchange protein